MADTTDPSSDRDQLMELLARYTDIPDLKAWDYLPATVFADEIEWDFSSLAGRPPAVTTREALTDRIRATFAGWKATLHTTTGHQITVNGDAAMIHAKVRAEHWLSPELAGDGPDRWLVVGFYDDEAIRTTDGWRLTKVKLTVIHTENSGLYALAANAVTNS